VCLCVRFVRSSFCFFLRDLQGVLSARLLICVCVRESECVYICVYTDLIVCIYVHRHTSGKSMDVY